MTEAAFLNIFVIGGSGTLLIMKYFLFQNQKYLNEIYSKRFQCVRTFQYFQNSGFSFHIYFLNFFFNECVYLQLICFIKDFLGFVSTTDVFSKVEMPTHYCLALLELNGIGFSTAAYETQKQVMQAKLSQIETKAYQLAGHSFSLTSPDDIAEVCEGWGGRGELPHKLPSRGFG